MAKAYINKSTNKQIKQKCIIKFEKQNKTRQKLKPKKRAIKESKGPGKREEKRREEKRREEKRREEKRRNLLFKRRATSKKSTLKKLAFIGMKNIWVKSDIQIRKH